MKKLFLTAILFFLCFPISGCALINPDLFKEDTSFPIEQIKPPNDNSPESLKRYELDIQKAKVMNDAAYKEKILVEEKNRRFQEVIRRMMVGNGKEQSNLPPPLISRHSTVNVRLQ